MIGFIINIRNICIIKISIEILIFIVSKLFYISKIVGGIYIENIVYLYEFLCVVYKCII